MTLVDWLSNIIIGIISGVISGYMVSLYFKKQDEESQWKRDLNDDKQNMSRYISLICWEFEQLMEGNGRETKDLQKLLQSPPMFKSFIEEKIKPEHSSYTKDAYDLFMEIDDYIKYEVPNEAFEIPKLKYLQFKSKLFKVRWNILMINNDVVEHDLINNK